MLNENIDNAEEQKDETIWDYVLENTDRRFHRVETVFGKKYSDNVYVYFDDKKWTGDHVHEIVEPTTAHTIIVDGLPGSGKKTIKYYSLPRHKIEIEYNHHGITLADDVISIYDLKQDLYNFSEIIYTLVDIHGFENQSVKVTTWFGSHEYFYSERFSGSFSKYLRLPLNDDLIITINDLKIRLNIGKVYMLYDDEYGTIEIYTSDLRKNLNLPKLKI
ncbi:MAG: hypothetical protein QW144_03050 [Candidatus Micrarchaeaceae archaeon]